MIRKRFDFWVPGKLRKAFKHFDQARSGAISEAELSHGLRQLKMRLSAEQEHTLFGVLDLDGSGKITYPEFVVFVRDPNHRDVSAKVLRRLRRRGKGGAAAVKALSKFDTNGSGLVGRGDFTSALDYLGVGLSVV